MDPGDAGGPGSALGESPNSEGKRDLDKDEQGTACGVGGGVKRGAWPACGGPGRPPRGNDL